MARDYAPSQLFQSWRSGRHWARLPTWCVLTAVTGLALALALANASLPDPLWLAGLYDGADYDDLIGSVEDVGSIGAGPPILEDFSVSGYLGVSDEVGARAPFGAGSSVRAPPIYGSTFRVSSGVFRVRPLAPFNLMSPPRISDSCDEKKATCSAEAAPRASSETDDDPERRIASTASVPK